MGMHDDGEYVDAAVGYRVPGAVRDAVTFRHNLRLAWRYDVPPVGVDTDAEDAGVVGAQLVRVMQTQAGTVAYERVHLRIRVVGLEHVVARPRVRIQRVAGLGRVIEPLRKEKPWRTRSIMRRVGNVLDESGAVGFMKRSTEGTLVEGSLSGYKWLFFTLFLVSNDSLDELLSSRQNSFRNDAALSSTFYFYDIFYDARRGSRGFLERMEGNT